jgi:hypothetical protein
MKAALHRMAVFIRYVSDARPREARRDRYRLVLI